MFTVPSHLVGPAYMVASCVVFAFAWVFVRFASETMDPVLIVFYRNLIGFLFLMPFYLREGKKAFHTTKMNLHTMRAISALCGTYGIFYAVSVSPLATVVAITFSAPIFATFGAAVFLGEKVHIRRIAAMAVGFFGVILVIRPFDLAMDYGTLGALIGAIAIAFSLIVIKKLTNTDRPETIVAYSFGLILPISFVVALFDWRWLSGYELGLVVMVGVSVFYGQMFLAKAFRVSEASAVLPLDFIRLILATIFGIILFDERFDFLVFVGAVIILAAAVYTARREAALNREKMSAIDPL